MGCLRQQRPQAVQRGLVASFGVIYESRQILQLDAFRKVLEAAVNGGLRLSETPPLDQRVCFPFDGGKILVALRTFGHDRDHASATLTMMPPIAAARPMGQPGG